MGTPGTPTFPTEGALTPPPTVSTATMQGFLENWLAACRMLEGAQPVQSVTISSGSITPDAPSIRVDTQAAAASDDLDNMVLTNYTEQGRVVVIQALDTNRTVVVRHGMGGSGQFILANGANYSLDDDKKMLRVRLEGTSWVEIDRFFGNDLVAFRAFYGIGSVVTTNTNEDGGVGGTVPVASASTSPAFALKNSWITKSAVDNHGGYRQISSGVVSGVSAINITSLLNANQDVYELEIFSFAAGAAAKDIAVQVSTDNGSTWKSGASDYRYAVTGFDDGGAGVSRNASAADHIFCTPSTAGKRLSTNQAVAKITIASRGNGGITPVVVKFEVDYLNDGGNWTTVRGSGRYNTVEAINAFRVRLHDGSNFSAFYYLYAKRGSA